MKVVLIAVGSRGDAEPFCAVSKALVTNGHETDIFLQSDLKHLADIATNVHELPFTQMDFYKFVRDPLHGVDEEDPRVRFTGIVTSCIEALVFPCCDSMLHAASNADIIITSSLARPLVMAIASKLGIPVGVVHLQPLVPTTLFPHFSRIEECVLALTGHLQPSDAFKDSYEELDRYHHEFLEDKLNAIYVKLDLPPLTFLGLEQALAGKDCNVHLINAFPDELIPSLQLEEGIQIHHVGPLADDYIPSHFEPPEKLVKFLASSTEPPVCIGFGSMPFEQPGIVMEALQVLNCRAILVGEALKLDGLGEWGEENMCHVSSIPYPWLLPQCSMMLSHGGAGVVNATLRAGIPAIISPLMGDQFTWARLLETKNIGVKLGNLPDLTKGDIVAGIRKGVECISEAKLYGKRIQSKPSGIQRMIDLIDDILKIGSMESSASIQKDSHSKSEPNNIGNTKPSTSLRLDSNYRST